MARERCNLDKEAEILKPSYSFSPSPSPPTPPSSPNTPLPPSLLLNPCDELSNPRPRTPNVETPIVASSAQKPKEEPKLPVRFSNRCSTCRKKVGLTGLRCQCGDLFYGRHQYTDTHDCSFDYKVFGREEIAKANPVVKAPKIIKI
ncbi:unnamed protein product [Musa hybrid cultivar]